MVALDRRGRRHRRRRRRLGRVPALAGRRRPLDDDRHGLERAVRGLLRHDRDRRRALRPPGARHGRRRHDDRLGARRAAAASTTRFRPSRSPTRARTSARRSRSTRPSSTPARASRASSSSSRPAGSGSWTPAPASWDTTAVADGFYDVRAIATDNAGNQAVEHRARPRGRQHRAADHDRLGSAGLDNDRTPTFAFSSTESPDVTYDVQRRRRRLRAVHEPDHARLARRRRAHARRPRRRPRRQRRRDPGHRHLDDRRAPTPTVSLTFPAPGALVSGIVTLTDRNRRLGRAGARLRGLARRRSATGRRSRPPGTRASSRDGRVRRPRRRDRPGRQRAVAIAERGARRQHGPDRHDRLARRPVRERRRRRPVRARRDRDRRRLRHRLGRVPAPARHRPAVRDREHELELDRPRPRRTLRRRLDAARRRRVRPLRTRDATRPATQRDDPDRDRRPHRARRADRTPSTRTCAASIDARLAVDRRDERRRPGRLPARAERRLDTWALVGSDARRPVRHVARHDRRSPTATTTCARSSPTGPATQPPRRPSRRASTTRRRPARSPRRRPARTCA